MKKEQLISLIREELKTSLNEYQDKFKMTGMLLTNIEDRPQKEIYSDIRSITGVTVISSKEPLEYNQQDTTRFKAILTVISLANFSLTSLLAIKFCHPFKILEICTLFYFYVSIAYCLYFFNCNYRRWHICNRIN